MKLAALLAATAAVALATPAHAQMRALNEPVVGHPDPESLFVDDDPVLHRNKQAALHIQRELLKCGHWADAGNWLTDQYIQHNPVAASGLEGVIYYFTEVAQVEPIEPCPALSPDDPNAVVAVIAEDDYVTILTRRIVPYVAGDMSDTYTTTWFDTWRFVDGKADQHWDPATLPGTPAPAPAPAAAPEDEEQARADIEDLMWRYVRAIDSWDADAYAQVFTEDGTFMGTTGRDALREMVTGMAENRGPDAPHLHHFMANQTIDFTGPDSAVVNYYWQTVTRGSPGADAPRMLAAGQGRDEVVRVDGEWLIANRDVAPEEG